MERLSTLYGKLLSGLALIACAILFFVMLMISTDVLLRNVALLPRLRGLAWSNEVSESMLYLITVLSAPWLLHRGQHIRVDIVLMALPNRIAWYCEWVADGLAFVCCLLMTYYGWSAASASYRAGSMTIKTLVTPEWWLLAVFPVSFALLAIEVLFRMQRLCVGERVPRSDAISTG